MERVRYGPTGRPETFPIADINFDGIVDTTDQAAMDDSIDAYDTDNADYDPRADLNRDGVVNAKDAELFDASYGAFAGPGNQWKLSQGTGITPGKPSDGYDNRFGWRGYWYDGYLQKYHVRHRVYDPRQGRWMHNHPGGPGWL